MGAPLLPAHDAPLNAIDPLSVAHGLTPASYREAFGLPRDYPLVAPAYAKRRKAMEPS